MGSLPNSVNFWLTLEGFKLVNIESFKNWIIRTKRNFMALSRDPLVKVGEEVMNESGQVRERLVESYSLLFSSTLS